MKPRVGQIITGTVTGVQTYGVFVDFGGTSGGLIHISEIKQGKVENLSQMYHVGDVVESVVIDVDEFTGRISLSNRSDTPQKNILKRRILKGNMSIRYWSNYRLHIGFSTLKRQMDDLVNDAKKRF